MSSERRASLDLYRINSLSDLKELLDLLRQFDIGEFEVEADGRKLRVSKGQVVAAPPTLVAPAMGLPAAAAYAAAVPAPAPSESGEQAAELPEGVEPIDSPMVGTFYRAPSPEADPFVGVGDRVSEGTTLCIVEAMKVMNEITAELSGVIEKILVENGDSVQFGQPLFHIRRE